MADMPQRFAVLGTFVWLSACGFSACGAPSATRPATTPEGAPGGYEVHEWGLLRGGPGDVLEVGTFAPTQAIPVMAVEKPVLYFHGTGTAPIELSVASVEAIEGTIREHWPLAAPRMGAEEPSRISWAPLTLRPERCALLAPGDRASACSALPPDEVCESLMLARTVTDDAWCAETASGPSPLLFYRSTSRGLSVPLSPAYLDFGDINVRNDSDLPIPGLLIRFIQGPAGLRIVVTPPPAPHQVILVGHEDQGIEAGRSAILTTMIELGLTASEADAFLRSWEGELFALEGERASEEHAEDAVEETPVERVARDTTTLLYFLPPELTERVSRLTFSPAPTATRRALAIWTAMP